MMNAHSVAPQAGSTFQPNHSPTGAQMSVPSMLVNAAKRASPPAFLAAMFQTAWISPARMTSASAEAGMDRTRAAPAGRA